MDEKIFHTVDNKSLKKINVEDILTGPNTTPEQIDYSVPVPTSNQKIPRSNPYTYPSLKYGKLGGIDPAALPKTDSPYRGRIGGC